MSRAACFTSLLALAAFAFGAAVEAGGPHAPRRPEVMSPEEIAKLVDSLATVSKQDVGYSTSVSGGGFAPLGRREPGAMLLFQAPPEESTTFTAVVAQGIAAVPALLARLGDGRPSALPEIKHEMGMGGMFLDAEYDRNRRLTPQVPTGTGLENQWAKEPRHRLSVGDLCFVALGQIVNRGFHAVRYQPTACIMVNSPVRSPALREAVTAEWGGLTAERHRASLEADVRAPDGEARRAGAILRLAYYYPDAFPAAAIGVLRLPCYDVYAVHDVAKAIRAEGTTPERRRALRDELARKHGKPFSDALHEELTTEMAYPAQRERTAAMLRDLYPDADPDAPVYSDALGRAVLARFIDALADAPSSEVDAEVWRVFRALGRGPFPGHSEDHVALACMRRLRGKGRDAELKAYCERPRSDVHAAEMADMKKTLR